MWWLDHLPFKCDHLQFHSVLEWIQMLNFRSMNLWCAVSQIIRFLEEKISFWYSYMKLSMSVVSWTMETSKLCDSQCFLSCFMWTWILCAYSENCVTLIPGGSDSSKDFVLWVDYDGCWCWDMTNCGFHSLEMCTVEIPLSPSQLVVLSKFTTVPDWKPSWPRFYGCGCARYGYQTNIGIFCTCY